MKKNYSFHTISLFAAMMVLLLACAADNSQLVRRQTEEGYRDVGREYMVQQKYTLALRELLRAEELYSEDHVLQDYIGICYREKGRMDQAIEHFEKALAIKPDYGIARNNLGSTYLKMKEWDKAIEQFKMITDGKYVDIYLTPHYPLSGLGQAYYNKKDFEQAQLYYEEALAYYKDGFKKDQYYPLIVMHLARTYLALAKYSESISLLKGLAEESSENKESSETARIHFELANTYRAAGNFGSALVSYRKVVELAPDTQIGEASSDEIEKLGNTNSFSE